jgi:hypothetical protein
MKKLLPILSLVFVMGAPAYSFDKDIALFKAKYYTKTAMLFPFRVTKNIVIEDMGLRESIAYAVYGEALNMMSRGGTIYEFSFFSWGD